MASAFEAASKAAIEEIIKERVNHSKFGYFLTQDSLSALTEDLFDLLKTSRNLKAAGDRILYGQNQSNTPQKSKQN